MRVDTSSQFMLLELTPDELQRAKLVSPEFLALLQNKIAAYAEATVAQELPYSDNPQGMVKAILAYERNRNFVAAYQELLSELTSN
jgi:hypothetical protein